MEDKHSGKGNGAVQKPWHIYLKNNKNYRQDKVGQGKAGPQGDRGKARAEE